MISNLFFPGSTGTKVLITTGEPTSSSTKTEVVDVKSGETCSDLDDFPLQIRGGVAANFLDGTPVVCTGGLLGSSTYYQTCYKLTISGWQEFASMNEKRCIKQLVSCTKMNSMFLEVTMAQAIYRQVSSSAFMVG